MYPSGRRRRSHLGAPARRGSSVIGRRFRWNRCRVDPATWVPRRRPRGSPAFFGRKPEERTPGASPLDPGFYGPLAAARSFWRLCHIVPVPGLLRYPCTCPDLETFFHKMLFQHIFPENASQIGLRISEETVPRTDPGQQPPKRASANERAIKLGVQGACPRPSFSPFLGRNGDPRRAGGAPGALRPEASEEPQLPEGYPPPAARGVANVPPRYG